MISFPEGPLFPNLTNLYSPSRYEDVVGQQAACDYLRSLTIGRKVTKNVLLHGDVGSGKTSLATVYARAMLCERPTTSGSPCGTCGPCSTPLENQPQYFEYDVPVRGGDANSVLAIVSSAKRVSSLEKPAIIFFDEAQSLEKAACEALLGNVEKSSQRRAGHDLAFVFATTDPSALSAALKSRLHPLAIRKLRLADARLLLNRVCQEQGVFVEAEALNFVVRFAGGHPRNLLNALEVAIDWSERRLTRDDAKRAFHFDVVDYLEDYFLALSAGDTVRQLELLEQWPDPRSEQIRWLQSYLTSFLYRTILRSDFECDVLVDALVQHRSEIARRFSERLGFRSEGELLAFWGQLVRAWDILPGDFGDDGAVGFARFSEIARCGSCVDDIPRLSAKDLPLTIAPQPTDVPFIGIEDVRCVLDSASAFVRNRGRYLNTLLEMRPWARGIQAHPEAEAMIDACVQAIMRNSARWGLQPFYIRVAENSKQGPIAFVAFCLPTDIDGKSNVAEGMRLIEFVEELVTPQRRGAPRFVRDVTPNSLQKEVLHRAIIRALLGGVSGELRLPPMHEKRVRDELKLGKQCRSPSRWHGTFVQVGGLPQTALPSREGFLLGLSETREVEDFPRSAIGSAQP